MSNENLKIWGAVKAVDKAALKQANIGGQNMLSVNGIVMVEAITAAIGPIGKNWYYSIADERYENTKPMMRGQEFIVVDGAALWEQTHTIVLNFHINHGDGFVTFPQFGHTPYRYMTKNGSIMVDQEAGKKSLTDALKKCLTMLGVAADVYSGALEDYHYAAQVQDEIEIKKADTSAEKAKAMIEEMGARMKSSLELIENPENDYAMAARSVRPNIAWFSNRMASTLPEISKPATQAVNKIESALAAKKQKPEQK